MDIGKNDSLGFLLFQVIRRHHQRSVTLMRNAGLNRGQPPILQLLWEKDGRTQKEMAELLRLRPATVTAVLKRMEKAHLIKRENDSEDLRFTRVYLTEKGKLIRNDVENALKAIEEECFKSFTSEEKVMLRDFFIRMCNNLAGGEKDCTTGQDK